MVLLFVIVIAAFGVHSVRFGDLAIGAPAGQSGRHTMKRKAPRKETCHNDVMRAFAAVLHAHIVHSCTMFSLAARSQAYRQVRRLSDAAPAKPVRKASVSMEERAANRAARKERASQFLAQARGGDASSTQSGSTAVTAAGRSVLASRWVWYAGVAIPAGLIFWGYNDEHSPPARFSHAIGMTDYISEWTDQFAQPSHEKLLPDWSQVKCQFP